MEQFRRQNINSHTTPLVLTPTQLISSNQFIVNTTILFLQCRRCCRQHYAWGSEIGKQNIIIDDTSWSQLDVRFRWWLSEIIIIPHLHCGEKLWPCRYPKVLCWSSSLSWKYISFWETTRIIIRIIWNQGRLWACVSNVYFLSLSFSDPRCRD